MAPKKEGNHSAATSSAASASASTATATPTMATTTTRASSLSSAEVAAAEQKQALYAANAKLCRLVRRCPWMYDRHHPHYAKKHIMDKSWAKIAKDCDDSVASCKERWRNIRAAFARSINIYKTHSGPNRVKPYYLHTELQFLIQPMLEGREMLAKDVDEIKTDFDDLETSPAPAPVPATPTATPTATSAASLVDDGECGEQQQQQQQHQHPQQQHLVEVTPHDLLSDVEADFGFPDDEAATTTATPRTTTAPDASRSRAHASTALNRSDESALTASSGSGGGGEGGGGGGGGAARAAISLCSLDYAPKRPRFSHDVGYGDAPDPDAKFLEALLPDMRAMNARQKIVFKRKVYQSLEEVFETSADFPPAATASAASAVVRSVAGLREPELHKLQDFLRDLQRQRGGVGEVSGFGPSPAATRPAVNGQALTVVPRAAATSTPTPTQRHRLRSLRSCNGNANGSVNGNGGVAGPGSGGNWEQLLQPITVKNEVGEDADVEDFE